MRLRYAALLALASDASAQCGAAANARLFDTPAISASVLPTGTLFYPDTEGKHFLVKDANGQPLGETVYTAGLWVAGNVGSELRASGETYLGNNVSYTPGPLSASGQPYADNCDRYNRVWIVTLDDQIQYDAFGTLTDDMRTWPYQAGAPVRDGDGVAGNYNLAGGDRPRIWGAATAWYVLNDVAYHSFPGTTGLGLEVQVTVGTLGYSLPGGLVVRHRLVYKPSQNVPLTDTFVGMWNDVDLGVASDDYIATDSTLSMIYTYNADNADEGNGGFGSANLPAQGVQLLQGPRVDTDGNGTKETVLRATSGRLLDKNQNNQNMYEPRTPQEYRYVLDARWRDGTPVTIGNRGYGGTVPTRWAFSGMPPNYWTEDQLTPGATLSPPGDRRGVVASGPFTMQPGETQDIVTAFPVAFGTDRIDAVRNLKAYAASLLNAYPVANDTDARPGLAVALGPNPTRGSLRGTVPAGQSATVALYDLLGRELHTLATLPQGGAFTADVSEATPGVYFVRIKQGTATAWHRLVVVR